MVGVNGARADGLAHVGVAPPAVRVFVAAAAVGEELAQLQRAAGGAVFLAQKPQKFLHDVAARVLRSLRMLANVAVEEPALGVSLKQIGL